MEHNIVFNMISSLVKVQIKQKIKILRHTFFIEWTIAISNLHKSTRNVHLQTILDAKFQLDALYSSDFTEKYWVWKQTIPLLQTRKSQE